MLASIFRAIFKKNDSPESLFVAALAAYDAGEQDRAEPDFVRVTRVDPRHTGAWLYAAACAFDRGDLALARERTAKGRALDPGNHDFIYLDAQALAGMGRSADAIAACREAVSAKPDFNPGYNLWSKLELPGEFYLDLMLRLHALIAPSTYLEIGVFMGESFQHAGPKTQALGVDPEPHLTFPLPANGRIIAKTSDEFFADHDVRAEFGGRPVALGFIDGMHLFEYALRDFINMERVSDPAGTILIHDCYPLHPVPAGRERRSVFWSGDIWRLILILKKYRPDLRVNTIATRPSGLGVVRGLDPGSTLLAERYEAIVAEFMALDLATLEGVKSDRLGLVPNEWGRVRALFPECV